MGDVLESVARHQQVATPAAERSPVAEKVASQTLPCGRGHPAQHQALHFWRARANVLGVVTEERQGTEEQPECKSMFELHRR